MYIVSLVLQLLLIFAFFFSGLGKIKGAQMQVETFAYLRLPQWFRVVTGWIALIGVAGLIIGFWNKGILTLSALWLACIMLGAIMFHIRSKDPINKMMPAAILMAFALILAGIQLT
ncbi:DoxX family protein [Cytobacillus horneckiae]|uniref:DoxX family protein n=1 Tax=Cytobacillus horneckiae TaxID=549687 RepID=A0A2N0Z9Q7_9BACI|nr:DoxX family protein [Cytobacillus horneckiae]MCM3180039.1 DoxX family protein [Cytobacillus horneckiae]MEC1155429.1 DoxX family protein [Cytobacillus horneckiae]MED2936519.1 DoxX family protein [Cytobacillus horneckiae]PKG26244.1 DoxX family protein [Cytobacillus horneckiae]